MTNNNIAIITKNGMKLSPMGYNTLMETVDQLEKGVHPGNWDINSYFVTSAIPLCKNKGELKEKVTTETNYLIEVFPNGVINGIWSSYGKGMVEIRNLDEDGRVLSHQTYTGKRGYEVLRDLTTPVALNFQ